MTLGGTVLKIDRQIQAIVRSIDVESLEIAERRLVQGARQLANELRLDVRDYEYAQTRAEQVKHARQARSSLEELEQHVVLLGGIFGADDTAQLSAQLDLIRDGLE